jgi:hypothetical protein
MKLSLPSIHHQIPSECRRDRAHVARETTERADSI